MTSPKPRYRIALLSRLNPTRLFSRLRSAYSTRGHSSVRKAAYTNLYSFLMLAKLSQSSEIEHTVLILKACSSTFPGFVRPPLNTNVSRPRKAHALLVLAVAVASLSTCLCSRVLLPRSLVRRLLIFPSSTLFSCPRRHVWIPRS